MLLNGLIQFQSVRNITLITMVLVPDIPKSERVIIIYITMVLVPDIPKSERVIIIYQFLI
jgi:hypothetical protein